MIQPRKRLGQHFLSDPNTARKIVDAVGDVGDAGVVEIGPGTGALTTLLVERYARFLAVEVDARAVEVLRERFPTLRILQQDVLTVDWRELAAEQPGGRLVAVGNLPYYITTPILFSLLDAGGVVSRAILMMQWEVADRLIARPGTKAYGALSVMCRLASRPEILFKVSRNVFFPRPAVESAVVALDTSGVPVWKEEDLGRVRSVVRAAFNQRRKTLRNSLKILSESGSGAVPERWASKRAEELEPDEFVELASYLGA